MHISLYKDPFEFSISLYFGMSNIEIELFNEGIMILKPKKPIEFRANNVVICYIELVEGSGYSIGAVCGKLLNEELTKHLPKILKAAIGECYRLIVSSTTELGDQKVIITNSFRLEKFSVNVDYKFIVPTS
jgi:hypothetical protein